MLASLSPRPSWSEAPEIATVFAADPFLRVRQHAVGLRKRGIRRVCNLPTSMQFGADFASALGQANLGYAKELARLKELAANDLQIYVAVTAMADVESALALRPTALVAVSQIGNLASSGVAEEPQLAEFCALLVGAYPDPNFHKLVLSGERRLAYDGIDGIIRYTG